MSQCVRLAPALIRACPRLFLGEDFVFRMRQYGSSIGLFLAVMLACSGWNKATADEIKVAVAANFTAPMRKIADEFEKETGHKPLLSFGTVGQFYAQLEQPAAVYGYGLALGILSTVLPSFLTSEGIARIGTAHTAIIGAAGPIATLLMAWLLLGEAITALQLLGTILVLYGVRQASSSATR